MNFSIKNFEFNKYLLKNVIRKTIKIKKGIFHKLIQKK